MKRVAGHEGETVVGVPEVVRVTVVSVQPLVVIVVIDVEDVRVAIGVSYV